MAGRPRKLKTRRGQKRPPTNRKFVRKGASCPPGWIKIPPTDKMKRSSIAARVDLCARVRTTEVTSAQKRCDRLPAEKAGACRRGIKALWNRIKTARPKRARKVTAAKKKCRQLPTGQAACRTGVDVLFKEVVRNGKFEQTPERIPEKILRFPQRPAAQRRVAGTKKRR